MLRPSDKPPFEPDDDVAGTCPTCGHRCAAKGRDARLMDVGFRDKMHCVECPKCRERTPKSGGRAVPVAKLPRRVLDFQI